MSNIKGKRENESVTKKEIKEKKKNERKERKMNHKNQRNGKKNDKNISNRKGEHKDECSEELIDRQPRYLDAVELEEFEIKNTAQQECLLNISEPKESESSAEKK